LLFVSVLCLSAGSSCFADLYTDPDTYGNSMVSGSLSSTVLGALTMGGSWTAATTGLNWSLTRNADGSWHYSYTFSAASGPGLSHLILEVSSPVTGGALGPFTLEYPDYMNGLEAEMDTFESQPANPGFPAGQSIWGIKYQDIFGAGTSWTMTFDSWRNPMWGDFYAKGGKSAYAFNSGLAILGGARIPVPDSSYAPVPAAVLLGVLGLGVAGLRLRNFV
jgi:hypothetical protein